MLLVEDDPNDCLLMEHVFSRSAPHITLHTVRDGMEAQDYLTGKGVFANRGQYPLPSLILLDLKLPRKTGLEVLKWMRAQPGLQSIRVIILTSSQENRDIDQAYQLGANSFIVKSVNLRDLSRMAEGIEGYATLLRTDYPKTF